jgi:hypothetical protein
LREDDMAVVYDAVTSHYQDVDVHTMSHTVAVAGNRLLVVHVHMGGVKTINSVTYGGVACSLHGGTTRAADATSHMYYLVAPLTGANNVVVSFSAITANVITARSFSKVSQATPLGAIDTVGSSGTAISRTPASSPGGIVCDGVGDDAGSTFTAGGSQTRDYYHSSGRYAAGSYLAATAGSATTAMSWTVSNGNWAYSGACVNPAVIGNQVIWLMFKRGQEFLRDLRAGLIPPNILKQRYGDLVAI